MKQGTEYALAALGWLVLAIALIATVVLGGVGIVYLISLVVL